jgi:hypothetical protein
MAEPAEVVQATETITEQQPSIQELAAFAFNKPIVNSEQPATSTAAQTENVVPVTSATETEESFDEPIYLKNNFGWENREAALAELNELRQLKANPPKVDSFKFENEESERLAKAINANRKEVYKILEKQERIEALETLEVNKETAADIIKFGMQLTNPTLSPQEIEFQYKQDYVPPKEPVQKASEEEDEFKERHDEWKEAVERIEMKRVIAAKMAQPQLAAAKQKIVLPDISSTVDEGYEAYKASNASADEAYNNVTVPALKSLKEADVPLSFNVNDANNKMQFDISIVPDATDFEAARQDSLSIMDFLTKNCYDKDGKFLPQNLQRIVLLANNYDKYGQAIARQAVNAERKRVIEQETVNGGGRRDFNIAVEPTELDQLKQFAFQKTG